MTPAAPRIAPVVGWLLAAVSTAALAQTFAPAPVPRPPLSSPAAKRAEAGVPWRNLSPAQREALAPLEREWAGIDAARKQKWLAVAARYPSLPAPERARISERMTDWARLTPAERGEVRLRYQEARQVPAPDRSARWEEYQNLPPDRKQQLAARAAPPAASSPGPRRPDAPAGQKSGPQGHDGGQAKSNLVPNPALAQRPRSVAPTVVQAAPGATTRFVTRPVTPPAHQQSGMPKISATPEFVNRSTLLPRRGPQAAGVAALPPTQAVPAPPVPPAGRAVPAAPSRSADPTPAK